GRAGPAAGSESCVVGGWPPLRSVDSQIKRCAIEPRNLLVVSLRRCQSRGPRQATHSWSTQPAWSRRGRRARTMATRVSKEPERPRRFHRQSGWGDRNRQLPGPRWDAHDRGEQTTGDTMVSAREEIRTGRDGRRGVGASHSIVEAGEPSRGTPWRERSEANCLTSGCKSRRRRSPCGAVVISGSLRGDSWAGSPDVQAPGGQVGLEPPWSGQHRGQAIRRAVAKANGLNAEMGPRTKLIQAEYWRC